MRNYLRIIALILIVVGFILATYLPWFIFPIVHRDIEGFIKSIDPNPTLMGVGAAIVIVGFFLFFWQRARYMPKS